MINRRNRTAAYQDIKRGYEVISHSTLCINMAKARRDKLTLKERINLIDASRNHSQQKLADKMKNMMTNEICPLRLKHV